MKLYSAPIGPNAGVVGAYLKLKKLTIPTEEIDIIKNDNRTSEYNKINVFKTVPSLQLDNGRVISQVTAIIEYLEEMNPSNPLIGSNAEERAETRMWWRWADLSVCEPILDAFRYAEGLELFKNRFRCLPEAANGLKAKAQDNLKFLNEQLAGKEFLCGSRFTIADVHLYEWLAFGHSPMAKQTLNPEYTNVVAWFGRVKAKLA